MMGRLSVLLVAVVAVVIALDRSSSILSLVSNAWAGFGAAFGPVVLCSLYWSRMTRQGALAGMIVGAATVLFWVYAPVNIADKPLNDLLYAMVPGVIMATIAIVVGSLFTAKPSAELVAQFEQMQRELKESQ
jgi:SSS family solute:Na+ symporter/sodium/proline symporter